MYQYGEHSPKYFIKICYVKEFECCKGLTAPVPPGLTKDFTRRETEVDYTFHLKTSLASPDTRETLVHVATGTPAILHPKDRP